MTIAIATTTVTVKGKRPQSATDPDADGYDAATPADGVLVTGVRASITLPAGSRVGNADETDEYTLRLDPVDVGLTRYDQIIDEQDSTEYTVVWAMESKPLAFGLDHIKAKLQLVRGLNSGGVSDESA